MKSGHAAQEVLTANYCKLSGNAKGTCGPQGKTRQDWHDKDLLPVGAGGLATVLHLLHALCTPMQRWRFNPHRAAGILWMSEDQRISLDPVLELHVLRVQCVLFCITSSTGAWKFSRRSFSISRAASCWCNPTISRSRPVQDRTDAFHTVSGQMPAFSGCLHERFRLGLLPAKTKTRSTRIEYM